MLYIPVSSLSNLDMESTLRKKLTEEEMERIIIVIALSCLALLAGTAEGAPLDTTEPPGTWVQKPTMRCYNDGNVCAGLASENPLISSTRCMIPVGKIYSVCWVQYRNCTDGNSSTYDTYSPTTGTCVHYPMSCPICPTCEVCAECFDDADCADGDSCTVDSCGANGQCVSAQTDFGTNAEGCCVYGQSYAAGESYCGHNPDFPEAETYAGNIYTCRSDGTGGHRIDAVACGGTDGSSDWFHYCQTGQCVEWTTSCQSDADCEGWLSGNAASTEGCDYVDGRWGFWSMISLHPCNLLTGICSRSVSGLKYCGEGSYLETEACACGQNPPMPAQ